MDQFDNLLSLNLQHVMHVQIGISFKIKASDIYNLMGKDYNKINF